MDRKGTEIQDGNVETFGLRRWFNKYFDTDFGVDTKEVLIGYEKIEKESVDYEVYLPDLEQAHANAVYANIRSMKTTQQHLSGNI